MLLFFLLEKLQKNFIIIKLKDKFIDNVQQYFRPFFETNLSFFCVLRMILALRSVANIF